MADIRQICGGYMADIRLLDLRIYGGHTADIRRTYDILMSRCHSRYSGHTAYMRRTHGRHAADMHLLDLRTYAILMSRCHFHFIVLGTTIA